MQTDAITASPRLEQPAKMPISPFLIPSMVIMGCVFAPVVIAWAFSLLAK